MPLTAMKCACFIAGTAITGGCLIAIYRLAFSSAESEEFTIELELDGDNPDCALDCDQLDKIASLSKTSIESYFTSPSKQNNLRLRGKCDSILLAYLLLMERYFDSYVVERVRIEHVNRELLTDKNLSYLQALRTTFNISVFIKNELFSEHVPCMVELTGKRNDVIEALKAVDDLLYRPNSSLSKPFSFRELEIGTERWSLAEITLINDIFEFYIKLIDDHEDEYEHLSYNLNSLCNERVTWPENVSVNDFVAARSSDGQWFRGQVLSFENNEYIIKNNDTGVSEKIAKEDIRIVGDTYFSLPFQSIDCMLGKVSSKHESECFELDEIEEFARLVKYNPRDPRPKVFVKCDFTLNDDGKVIHAVDIKTQDDVCIADELVRLGTALAYVINV